MNNTKVKTFTSKAQFDKSFVCIGINEDSHMAFYAVRMNCNGRYLYVILVVKISDANNARIVAVRDFKSQDFIIGKIKKSIGIFEVDIDETTFEKIKGMQSYVYEPDYTTGECILYDNYGKTAICRIPMNDAAIVDINEVEKSLKDDDSCFEGDADKFKGYKFILKDIANEVIDSFIENHMYSCKRNDIYSRLEHSKRIRTNNGGERYEFRYNFGDGNKEKSYIAVKDGE